MATIGYAGLVVGLLTMVYAAGASIYGVRSGERQYVVSARYAFYCLLGLMVLAVVILESAYLRNDFSYSLVAQNSSTDTPTFYKLTAMWSSQAGSLLLWAFVLSLFSSVVLHLTRHKHREIVPYATAVLAGIAAFFLSLMIFYSSPFDTLSPAPAEGNGLEPLLRHPAMMFHPPMLYSGYVGFTIPFAFCIGALIARRTDAEWIRSTRRFALIAWTFLGVGIMLGALWSYSELGWGGYWAWDPVENASLMPWLIGTAFLHSIMVQEKRGMLKVWNVSLIIGTFVLALLGTFLVRSGVLDSIHAFGASTLGVPFLAFIGIVLVGSVALVLTRLPDLRSEAKIDSLFSRESVFLLNNLVLVGLCFVIFWGTFFPLISEAVTGTKSSVGPPWFDRYTVPLALVLVLLSGIGPVIAWRRVTLSGMRRVLAVPLLVAGVTLVVLLAFTGAGDDVPSLIMFVLAAFVLAVVAQEFGRGARARAAVSHESSGTALLKLVGRNRRRYGGYIVHAGMAVLFIGVAASSAFAHHRDAALRVGQSVKVGGYTITYKKATSGIVSDRAGTGAPITVGAVLDVRKGDKHYILRPSRNYYSSQDTSQGMIGRFFGGEANSEISMRWGIARTVWTAIQPDLSRLQPAIARANRQFGDANPNVQGLVIAAITNSYLRNPPPAQFRMIVSPFVAWIWIGGALALFGALIAAWPSPEARMRRVTSMYAARLGRELS
ncbi:MAG TPA: heme lyase CcmF/NrfE family subunit, partial [Candidatus Dormibacteraeota bacterium]|nr:heme lyase CcmF/NrfE family subunit [Candidatus Dormibacteraeota bacterium]